MFPLLVVCRAAQDVKRVPGQSIPDGWTVVRYAIANIVHAGCAVAHHKREEESMRPIALAAAAAVVVFAAPLQARVTRIVIDDTVSPAFCSGASCQSFGNGGQYEQLSGRAFGELD